MFQRSSVKKPKLSVEEAAEAIFNKLFKNEINRACIRIREHLADREQIVNMEKFRLIVISLFVFVVDHTTTSVYGTAKTKNRLLKTFNQILSEEFHDYMDIISEYAQKLATAYRKNSQDPVEGIGMCFSECINMKNRNDILTAIAGATECARKMRLISKYYKHINEEFILR